MGGLTDVTSISAFAAGVISFLSPCVLPLVTGHITYITGCTVEEELEGRKAFALKRTIGFIVGFTTVFMLFGLSFGTIGMYMKSNRELLNKISGAFIVFMGLNMTGLLKLNFKGKKIRKPREINSWLQSVAVGLAFGVGWTPCIGPVLGAILFYAGSQADASRGAYLLLLYSMGLSLPFIVTTLFIDRISKLWNRMGDYTQILRKLSGMMVVALGVMVFLGKTYLITNLAY